MLYFYLIGVMFLLLSIFMFIFMMVLMFYNLKIIMEWVFLDIYCLKLSMFIYVDYLSMLFMSLVMVISSMIMFYCIEYMSMDLNKLMFIYLMSLFVLSMMLVIVSMNMFSMILGWDLLGLISYLLVIFYQNCFSLNSGMLTFLMNRIGDIMLMLSISLMFIYYSFNYLFIEMNFYLLLVFIIICVMTKSAQIPFSIWLPAAMAAPTPVSSLVHSSTLVTAGIYILIRMNFIMMNSFLLNYLVYFSMVTMLMSGFMALYSYDLKKIVAYSTLSQLGMIFMIYCLMMSNLSFFHLMSHAMFKSLLFMCCGVMIHLMKNFQDIRMLGMLMNFVPLTMMMFNISNMSLCGMYFFSGFYSKDIMLESSLMLDLNYIMFILIYISTMLTMMYSMRLVYYSMFMNFNYLLIYKFYESKFMINSMFLLMIMSIIGGSVLNMMLFYSFEFIVLILMLMFKMLLLLLLLISIFYFYIKFKLMKIFLYFYMKFLFMMIYLMILNIIFMKIMKFLLVKINYGWVEFIFIKMNYYYLIWFSLNKFNSKYLFDFKYFLYFILLMLI
uniref:NADH:ubiquinone reductase (H(+)-translocating) n=1 Tax=Belyta sp. ZJUH_2016005 TaxID=2491151 RepID=A0A3S8V0D2_9HYME|nr:NADH dehydrogenase subunit 5 [Belyta sp. ZJUH_2016005]